MTTTSGLSINHSAFAACPRHIPNGKGEPFKTELVFQRSEARTDKINFWHGPDDDRPPHNHPWRFLDRSEVLYDPDGPRDIMKNIELLCGYDVLSYFGDRLDVKDLAGYSFVSEIMHGSLTHAVYWAEGSNVLLDVHHYEKGEVYAIKYDQFHLVTEVAPGTVTRMICGPVVKALGNRRFNEWGYMDKETGVYWPATPDPTFMEKLRDNNRFLK